MLTYALSGGEDEGSTKMQQLLDTVASMLQGCNPLPVEAQKSLDRGMSVLCSVDTDVVAIQVL
jgi:hypothetical protein